LRINRQMEQDFAKRRPRTPLAEPSAVPQSSSVGLLLTGLVTGIAVGLFIALMVYLSGALPPAPGQAEAPDSRQITSPSIAGADSNGGLTQEQQREAQRLQLEFYQELPNYEVVVNVTPIAGAVPRTPLAVTANADSTADTTVAAETVETAAVFPEAAEAAETVTPRSDPVIAAVADSNTLDPVSAALAEISNRTAADTAAAPASATATGPTFMLQAGAFQQQATATTQLNRLLGLGLNARIREETLPGRTLYLVQAGPYDSRDEMMQAERVLRSNSIDSMRITLSQP
jgi:cell division protein FtsN